MLFPTFCFHCKEMHAHPFCKLCLEGALLSLEKRCPVCFTEKSSWYCPTCPLPYRRAALFSSEGPFFSLYQEMKKGRLLYYRQGFAAYLFYRLEELQWEYDLITYPPQGLLSKVFLGKTLLHTILLKLGAYVNVRIEEAFVLSKESPFHRKFLLKEEFQRKKILLLTETFEDAERIETDSAKLYLISFFESRLI